MDIEIEKDDCLAGTTAWLINGILNGNITFYEDNSEICFSRLVMRVHSTEEILAIFWTGDYPRIEYKIVIGNENNRCKYPYTPACKRTLCKIAHKWCRQLDEIREADQDIDVSSIQVHIKGSQKKETDRNLITRCFDCVYCSEAYPNFQIVCDLDNHCIKDVYHSSCDEFVRAEVEGEEYNET